MIAIDVSVIIPCYNQARFLREAIGSIDPGALEVEIIVVDDGSTDDTAAVAEAAGAVCIRQPNRGLAAARNTGLRASMGRFLVFLDADDRLMPGALETGVAALETHPGCALAYGRCVMMGPAGEPWPTRCEPRVDRDHHAALLRRNLIWMPGMAIFRREPLLAAGGFAEEGIDAAADYDLYLRLSREHPVVDHGTLVAAYRQHAESMSGDASRMLRETLTVMDRHRPDMEGDAATVAAWTDGRRDWRDFYGTHLVEEIRAHVHGREWRAAFRKAATLARLHPEGLAWHARRKMRIYAGRAIPAAEIWAAIRRASSSSGR